MDDAMLQALDDTAQEIHPGVYFDRLVTGRDWWTVGDSDPQRTPMRYTLFSVKVVTQHYCRRSRVAASPS